MAKHVQLAVVGLLLCALVSGCGLVPVTGGDVCADWVLFEKPQDQFDEAGLVLVGKPAGSDGETSLYGYTAQLHVVEIEAVLKGEPEPGQLRIASMPATCTQGVSYPDGDPLDRRQRTLIYATKQNGYWFTMTPAQGAVPFETGTPLPFTTTPAKG
jgi:hypothetical protein